MLICDPTEANSATRNPENFLANAVICQNLEAVTGADFMISPLDSPNIKDLDSKLGQIFFKKHLDAGSILVQRKTSADIVNFITDYAQIIAKMLSYTRQVWLLTVGVFTCDSAGKLEVNGKRVGGSTGWSYWAYQGALRAWQENGGYVVNLADESLLLDWYKHVEKKLQEPVADKVITPRKPSQIIDVTASYDENDPAAYEKACAIAALSTIEGISTQKALEIVNYCGNLAHSLVFLSDVSNLALPNRPKGIGSKLFANASKWLGLKTAGIGDEQYYEVITIDEVYPQRKV